jgi:hypothetical protein
MSDSNSGEAVLFLSAAPDAAGHGVANYVAGRNAGPIVEANDDTLSASAVASQAPIIVRSGCDFTAGDNDFWLMEAADTLSRASSVPIRSDVDAWRIALHEAGHCVNGKVLGQDVAGCTIVPGDGYGGLTWGPLFDRSMLSTDNEVPDLCEKIAVLMPGPGESRINVAEIFAHCHVRVVDLMSGTAAEMLLHPQCPPWTAHSDVRHARATASLICTSESAIDHYLSFGLAEAKALIEQHRAAVLAIAEALMIERTLNAEQIDAIIAAAPERARRAAWIGVQKNAASFVARLEN